MKITNVDKGKAYHLSSDTMLQVERPNLFFNEYGEQTNPVLSCRKYRKRLYPKCSGQRPYQDCLLLNNA